MSEQTQRISRFSIFQRVEHWLLVASFTILACTSPYDSPWGKRISDAFSMTVFQAFIRCI